MEASKTPTLTIISGRPKVFGKPSRDASSVTSESMSETQKGPKITIRKNNPKSSHDNASKTSQSSKKRQSKIPSHTTDVIHGSSDQNFDDEFNNDDDVYYSEDVPIHHEKADRPPSIASKNSSKTSKSRSSIANSKQASRTQNYNYKSYNDSTISTPSSMKTSQRKQSISSQANLSQQNEFSSVSPSKLESTHNNTIDNAEQIDYNSNDDYDEYDRSPAKTRNISTEEQEEEQPTKKTADDYPDVTILPVVEALIEENAPSDKIGEMADKLEDWQKSFLKVVEPIEQQQKIMWYKSMMHILEEQKLGQANDSESIAYYQEMVTKAREVLLSHRFAYPAGTNYRFKIAITGLDLSGKSTFLSVFAQQYLLELAASNEWKHTFIFPVDTANIASMFDDLASLYNEIVEITFSALSVQKPLLIPYADSLTHAFLSVISGTAILPKSFLLDPDFRTIIPELQQFLDIVSDCWQDPAAMEPFIVNTFLFPYFISKIFGFQNFTVIADHFDLSDVTTSPAPPFIESNENVFMSAMFKSLLSRANYIVSGKHSTPFVELLTIDEQSHSGTYQMIEMVSTLHIVDYNDEDSYKFTVAFESSEDPPLQLSSRYMGGCPIFLEKWEEITEKAKKIEHDSNSEEEDADDIEEQKLELNNLVQGLLKLVMVSSDLTPYNLAVKNVSPIHASQQ